MRKLRAGALRAVGWGWRCSSGLVMMMCPGAGRVSTFAGVAGNSMGERFFPRDDYFMRLALREAELASEHEDVPIGAVIVRDGEGLSSGHNERELRGDPTAPCQGLALPDVAPPGAS